MIVEKEERILEATDFESEQREIVKVGNSKGVTFPAWWFRIKRFLTAKVKLTPVKDEKGRLCILIEKVEEKPVASK